MALILKDKNGNTFQVAGVGKPGTPGQNGTSAYQAAVAGGYTGTEADFNERMAKGVFVGAGTALATGWTGQQNTVTITGLPASVTGIVGVSGSAGDDAWQAAVAAVLRPVSQAAGSVTIKALGTPPDVDIPISIYYWPDTGSPVLLSMFPGTGEQIPLDAPTGFTGTAGNAKVTLTWTDPKDKYATPEGETTEEGDQLVSEWDYTRIIRKTGSAPTGPNDGVLVVESSVRDQYASTGYVDSGLTNGTTYYYGAYAYNKDGVASEGAVTGGLTPIARPANFGTFGVQWDTTNSSTALTRLTTATDPNGYVDRDVTTEPVPAVGTGAGSSPFDAFMPWMGMEEYNIIDGQPLYKQGNPGFSRSQYDTMVWVPEFWYHIEQDGNLIRYYISSDEKPGFEKHPGSGRYMSRYTAGTATYKSHTGNIPIGGQTRATARTQARNKGANWQQDDYASWCARNLLYLVEFADFNSQVKIGRGLVDMGNVSGAGGTDTMVYHTGRAAGTDGQTAVQYRHLENLWGNVDTWVDGINCNAAQVWVSTNPSNYADNTSNGYTNIGNRASGAGYIRAMAVQSIAPWAMFPTQSDGSSSTYVPDFSATNNGWTTLAAGGPYDDKSDAGLWSFYGDTASTVSQPWISVRLEFLGQAPEEVA